MNRKREKKRKTTGKHGDVFEAKEQTRGYKGEGKPQTELRQASGNRRSSKVHRSLFDYEHHRGSFNVTFVCKDLSCRSALSLSPLCTLRLLPILAEAGFGGLCHWSSHLCSKDAAASCAKGLPFDVQFTKQRIAFRAFTIQL
ncbi:hypothetical protein CEXT_692291 [Caerostris extrusa]|uniref:Uncharacterized protein n=1 Tax=Caerostris extrusa TaxID=172846 RepID=A0AAV4W6I6_CAEEX|nr:hypothetical protein CEXT_692291 [Caerostris extrusa]